MGLPARADLVLRFGLEIAGVMALVQLFFGRPAGAVDHSPALDGRARADFFRPACQVFIFVRLQYRNPLFFGFLSMGLRTHLVRFSKFEKKARGGCSNEVFLITRARDWFHCAGIEEAVYNEILVDVNANHLTECNEPWGGVAVDIFELDRLQPLAFQRAW